MKWGSEGTANGQFGYPLGIAVDASRNIYISDGADHRIQKFTPNGVFISTWEALNYQTFCSGIAVDSSGNVYVAGESVSKFTADGAFLGALDFEDEYFHSCRGVAVDSGGAAYVVDEPKNLVHKFIPNVTRPFSWGSAQFGQGNIPCPDNIGIGPLDEVYITTYLSQIYKLSANGASLDLWTDFGSRLLVSLNVAIDHFGYVYILENDESWVQRIQKFTKDGAFLTQWGSPGDKPGQFEIPKGIAVDIFRNIYVADPGNNRIQKFSADGTFIAMWGNAGSGNGQFDRPQDVAVDKTGNVYVVDTRNFRIQKFTSDGAFLTQWGDFGSDEGQFYAPDSIEVDADGNVYVADAYNRIQKFTPDGGFVAAWAETGSGPGQFAGPRGVAVDHGGNVYVADFYNNRVQKFRPE